MKLSNWLVAVLVFFSTLLGMWLLEPSRVGMVGAAAPNPAMSEPPDYRHHLRPVLTLGGLAGYIPIWTDADKILNSIIYQDASNVGIGTTTPGATLEVNGPAKFDGSVTFAGGLSVPASDLTGVVGTANGGTGIDTAPTAEGQYLRASGAGTWSISAIESTDVPTAKDLFEGSFIATAILPATTQPILLPFDVPSVYEGWSTGINTLYASDTGLSLGILNVTALFVSPSTATLTLQLLDNGSPVTGTHLTFTGAASTTVSGSEGFLVSVNAGDGLSVQASWSPSSVSVDVTGQLLLIRLK
jgi:hypothetical protein